jgi:two-component system, OmpR family, response regulator
LLRRSKTDRNPVPEAEPPRQVSKGVLVVNDDEDMCELLCRLLQSTGQLVAYRAHSSDGALEELTEHQTSIDAVILDFTGGTATSFAVLEAIRRRPDLDNPAVIIVATTTANRVLAFDSGVDEFLTRPFHANDFLALVMTVLSRSPEEREAYRTHQTIAGRGLTDLQG